MMSNCGFEDEVFEGFVLRSYLSSLDGGSSSSKMMTLRLPLSVIIERQYLNNRVQNANSAQDHMGRHKFIPSLRSKTYKIQQKIDLLALSCPFSFNYNSKFLTLIIMKRTKSLLSMRNLAASIKQSIQLDAQRFPTQMLKTTKSVATLIPKQRYSQSHSQTIPIRCQQKENRIFVIQKQITTLEKELKDCSSSVKGYDSDLSLYDQNARLLLESQKLLHTQKMEIEQIKNQIMMLEEEVHSNQFNVQQNMAEKQYHQELIETYGNQYEAQSKLVFKIVDLQLKNEQTKQKIKDIDLSIEKSKADVEKWKKEIQFQLNEHKLKNSIKIVRMQLISLEDQCDNFCNQNNLRKIRELYCLYFKNYAKMNGIGNEEAEQGLDIFICKHSLAQDFAEFARERLVYNKPKCSLIEQYLLALSEMEQIYKKSVFQANRKIYMLLKSVINQFQQSRAQKKKYVQQNQQKIKALNDQIDDLFNNDSIAVIQYMREMNKNKYDLKEIKGKLRQNKKEQRHRIAKIRSSFQQIKDIDKILEKYRVKNITNLNRQIIEDSTQNLIQAELHLDELEKRNIKQKKQKEVVEDRISNAITQWRQMDEKKDKLKRLYQELQIAKKLQVEVEDRQEYKFTKNHHEIWSNGTKSNLNQKQQIRIDRYDDIKSIKNHSKNTSICSLNQSKSVLSLSNPFKKTLEKSVKQTYQPILSNCQLILSRKLTHKELQIYDLEQKNSNVLKNNNQLVNCSATKKKKIIQRLSKQNDSHLIICKNKTSVITPYKQLVGQSAISKGKICLSQRQSLSKLLISKFNR